MRRALTCLAIFGLTAAACAPDKPDAVCTPTVQHVDNRIPPDLSHYFANEHHYYDYYHVTAGAFGDVTDAASITITVEEPNGDRTFDVSISEREHKRSVETAFDRNTFIRMPTGWLYTKAADPYFFSFPATIGVRGWQMAVTHTAALEIPRDFVDAPDVIRVFGEGAVYFDLTAARNAPVTTYTIPCAE
jgi:hypothetical protein